MSVGKNVRHDSSFGHVTGQSVFIDDRPSLNNEVHVGLVLSPVACGKINKIDFSKALEHEDCLGVYTAKDFAAKKWGPIAHDQQFLASDKIEYMSEPVCIIASSNRLSLEAIRNLVELDITEQKGIFTIEDAKAAGKDYIIYSATPFKRGDVNTAFQNADHILEGTFKCGGQEHFYLESQAAIVYPTENNQFEVHSSSQHPSESQRVVAEALGIPFHHVVSIVKRMGGGFGGKESQAAPIAAYAAIVAKDLNRPARIILTKDEDMVITGKRHPFENGYKVAFNNDGKITAMSMDIKSDAGAYADLSSSILERAMFHADGAYYVENVYIEGTAYRTNNHSNTAFRGFGGPQGNMTIESIIEDMAAKLNMDSYDIRRLNCYQGDNNTTPYGQVIENNFLPQIFDELVQKCDYKNRKKQIDEFNKKSNGIVKGISLTATKFGIAFTAKFLNQGNALVNVHLDGTAQVSTGATEMGQGVNTKIAQIVSHAFGIPMTDIQVMSTSTEKNHNTSPTAASSGSDINGAAALKACHKIKKRLTGLARASFNNEELDEINDLILKEELDSDIVFEDGIVKSLKMKKEISFKELVTMAYFNRVSLGDYAHFKTPGLGFDKGKGVGKAFNYFTQGAVASEVSVDTYTGESKVLRTDILMDLGRPINPGIDKGQVTGAFIQGMGWVTTENLYYNDKRFLVSHSPTTYKIPNVQDTPRVFNVDFIENNTNDCNVYKSKAVGEPPFILGLNVWAAIKNAISNTGDDSLVELDSPATNNEILMSMTKRL
ncbi:MAG: xanthine dehydrogenase molybdopterin binding subunit [Bacteriovoracaceae bacterium]|jgi:xanthine dehydrogenase large subunit|nr:xanthine dehydrogenase molybdopterin binding subunit [Bacteriovoracaceae bacterium]